MEKFATSVYDYVKQQETAYQTVRIPLATNWDWNMYEHIDRTFLMKWSKKWLNPNDFSTPTKNIVLPIVKYAHRTEGFDVKDIVPFVNDIDNYHKSFLVKKYHPRWARKNEIDTFIDNIVEGQDYGLSLVKKVKGAAPEFVPLQRLAFCDQTNILSGPICEKHGMSVDDLMEMDGKWGNKENGANVTIDELILLASQEKTTPDGKIIQTTGKNVEVYELHGFLPESWLKDDGDESKFVRQMHIIAYYNTDNGEQGGVTLYKGKEKENIYKALVLDEIFGRACGWGRVENLFDPQIWTNYSEVQLKEMLDLAASMVTKTTDKKLAKKNKLSNLPKGAIIEIDEGKTWEQVIIQPYNKAAFDYAVNEWEKHAMTLGAATEGSLGKNPSAGTPFALQNLIVQEGKGDHDYRQGKIATFVGNLYRDWFLDDLKAEMSKGKRWLDELTLEEMQWVAERLSNKQVNEQIINAILSGDEIDGPQIEDLRIMLKDEFKNTGNKQFLEIIKDELKDLAIDVEINIKNKQKNLAEITDKLVNVFRTVIAAPQILQAPGMADLFNQIIESSGLNPVDFSGLAKFTEPMVSPIQANPAQTQPLQELTSNQK